MKTVRAIDAIKAGGFLMAEYDEVSGELKYRCVPGGGGVTTRQAERLIRDLELKPSGDALFPEMAPQTWRL